MGLSGGGPRKGCGAGRPPPPCVDEGGPEDRPHGVRRKVYRVPVAPGDEGLVELVRGGVQDRDRERDRAGPRRDAGRGGGGNREGEEEREPRVLGRVEGL